MKKTKGIVTGINLDAGQHQVLTVDQASYTKYAATVFSAPKNFALEVDLGTPTSSIGLSTTQLRNALKTTANSLQTDCVLMGGDSGGPLFSIAGELIGVHSQISEGRDQNVHVSLAPFFRSWEAMKESRVVRVWDQGGGGWLGVATRVSDDGLLQVDQVAPNSPAARAGMRSGDTVVSFDGRPLHDRPNFSAMVNARAAGDPVVLVVRNRSGERILTMKLAPRPPD
jgi:serine protease Do